MSQSKEYFIRLQEAQYEELEAEDKIFLNKLGMSINYKPTIEDENDEQYKELRKQRIKAYNKEQDYLFQKRNKNGTL